MAVVFFANGAVFANWVARVPAVKDRVDAGTGSLGIALLGIAVGSLTTMPFAGRLCARLGSPAVVVASGLAVALALFNVALAPNVVLLGVALAFYGGSFGLLDVAMNVQAVAVVRRSGRPVMPWFHAAFSFGGLVGAGTGGLAAGGRLQPSIHFALVGAAIGAAILAVRPLLLPDRRAASSPRPDAAADPAGEQEAGTTRPSTPRPRISPVMLGLGAIAGCAAIIEGAMADWSTLFLRDVRDMDAGTAALGFAAFSITMTAGRLAGEAAIRRAGPVRVLRLGGLTGVAGVLLAVLVDSAVAGVAGFGLVGVGMCCVFPLALTTAGESGDGSGGSEIATVSVIGYLGFLVGPPLIGLLAEVVELRSALLAVAVPALALMALAPALTAARSDRTEPVPELV